MAKFKCITIRPFKSGAANMQSYVKHLFDLIAALALLLIFLPVLIGVAVMIKLTSPGPVLFQQKRLTLNQKEFIIYKFRSMYTHFDKNAVGIQIKGSSQAITPLGKFLRKSKLDELPQLWNILKGDMSFVGPRPELPRRLPFYSESDKEIFRVRSGVTSPASVILAREEFLMEQVADPESFYIHTLMPYKIALNKNYIQNQKLALDVAVMAATALKLIGIDGSAWLVTNPELLHKRNALVPPSPGIAL